MELICIPKFLRPSVQWFANVCFVLFNIAVLLLLCVLILKYMKYCNMGRRTFHYARPVPPAGGGVGGPEARSDGVRGLLCRDLQRRQQAETLHGHSDDRLPGTGAAGEWNW